MGKSRDIFKNIRDSRGTFHAKMGTIKDRNYMDLTEAKDINQTEELYLKGLNDLDKHGIVVTHLKPGIPEYEVKWAVGNRTTKKIVEVMEFQLSYLKSQKMTLLK